MGVTMQRKVQFLRWLLFFLIALCILLFAAITFYRPANYLVTNRTLPTQGWQIHGAKAVQFDATAPDGSLSALKITSTSGDGHLVLPSRNAPKHATETFSIYLRADSRTTINIGFFGKKYVSKTARIGIEWQRFSISGNPEGGVSALVAGARTFLEGETIYVWGPQLELGAAAKPYVQRDTSGLSWPSELFVRLRYGSVGPWLLLAAATLGLVLLVVSINSSPMSRARRMLRHGLGAYRSNEYGVRTVTTYAAITLATLIAMEIAAFAIGSWRISQAQSQPIGAMFGTLQRAIALVTADAKLGKEHVDQATIFSPLTQVRRLPGDLTPPYHINRLGLIDNEGASPVLDTMPEKPAGMIRVILYGGSTAMGIGAPAGNQTLTARLEKLLNLNARSGTVFQVLNLGHGGGQSYSDLAFMAAMGTYLDPDVSISLNGFNDAFFASESSFIYGAYPYVINWSDFSYYYNNTINNLTPPSPAMIAFLPFTSLLYNDLRMQSYMETAPTKSLYAESPMRLVTENFDKQNATRDRLLLENLRFMAGYFVKRPGIFVSYLQPHPLQFRDLLTSAPAGPDEKTLVDQSIVRLSRLPADEYRRRMDGLFDAYGDRYRQLQGEFREHANIRFFDIRNELRDLPEAAYIDIIHYSVAGQQRLAERMFTDLKSHEVVRSRLRD